MEQVEFPVHGLDHGLGELEGRLGGLGEVRGEDDVGETAPEGRGRTADGQHRAAGGLGHLAQVVADHAALVEAGLLAFGRTAKDDHVHVLGPGDAQHLTGGNAHGHFDLDARQGFELVGVGGAQLFGHAFQVFGVGIDFLAGAGVHDEIAVALARDAEPHGRASAWSRTGGPYRRPRGRRCRIPANRLSQTGSY